MANLSSWFQRLVPLPSGAAQAAADGARRVITEASKNPAAEQQQVASADATSVGKRKTEG